MPRFSPEIGFEETDRLARLLDGKLASLMRLRALCERQETLIDANDTKSLLETIAEKDGWIALLAGIERDLAPYRDQPPEWRLWRAPAERERCGRTAAECRLLLEEMVLREKHCEDRLLARRRDIAEMLRNMAAAEPDEPKWDRSCAVPGESTIMGNDL